MKTWSPTSGPRSPSAASRCRPRGHPIAELLEGRPWLFADDAYHIDISHLSAVVRISPLLTDPTTIARAVELTDYGRNLSPRHQSEGEPPFEDHFADHGAYLRALLGHDADAAVRHFRAKLGPAEGEVARQRRSPRRSWSACCCGSAAWRRRSTWPPSIWRAFRTRPWVARASPSSASAPASPRAWPGSPVRTATSFTTRPRSSRRGRPRKPTPDPPVFPSARNPALLAGWRWRQSAAER